MRSLLLIAFSSCLWGCTDDLVGRWESDDQLLCINGTRERVVFTVDDELVGRGGYCSCDFDFTADPRGDQVYRLDINFDGPCFIDGGKYDCTLRGDSRFDCGNLGDYNRIGD